MIGGAVLRRRICCDEGQVSLNSADSYFTHKCQLIHTRAQISSATWASLAGFLRKLSENKENW